MYCYDIQTNYIQAYKIRLFVLYRLLGGGGDSISVINTYPLLQRVPFKCWSFKSVIVKWNCNFTQKIIPSETVIVPNGQPQGSILQFTFSNRILKETKDILDSKEKQNLSIKFHSAGGKKCN